MRETRFVHTTEPVTVRLPTGETFDGHRHRMTGRIRADSMPAMPDVGATVHVNGVGCYLTAHGFDPHGMYLETMPLPDGHPDATPTPETDT